MINKIAIIMAMREEAKPIIEHFNLLPTKDLFDQQLPMEVYSNSNIFIILNGKDPIYHVESIGTQSAVITTLSVIQKIQPDLIINAGTAGGFAKRGGKIGEVYSAKSGVCFHDKRIPLGDYAAMGLGNYNCLEIPNLSQKLGLKQGVVTTGNSLDIIETDEKIIDSYKGELKDMEAAAIAMICQFYNMPLIILKSITDIVDGPHPIHEEFMENLELASHNLKEKCQQLIHEIQGKTIDQVN
ncbi:MAG: hypothetical protein ACEPOV_08805 [Hyphomicrobiales bacterium]